MHACKFFADFVHACTVDLGAFTRLNASLPAETHPGGCADTMHGCTYPAGVSTTTSWATWLRARLAEHDWDQSDLIRASHGRLDAGLVSRWLSGDNVPQLPNIRVVCRALGVPAVEGMIAAGRLEPGDVGITLIRQRPRPADLSARELGEEVTRRLSVAESVESPSHSVQKSFPQNVEALGQEGEAWAARRRKPDKTEKPL